MMKRKVLWIFILVFTVLIGMVGYKIFLADSSTNTNPSTNINDEKKDLIYKIVALAKEGKVINSEFAIDTDIEDVKKAWGKPDKEEYIAEAKGIYCTYEKQGVVFAYNKGLRIFEVRSFAQQLKSLTLEDVKEVLGTPDFDRIIFGNQHHMIGYRVNDDNYKLEFVFPKESGENPHPTLDHMNVLDPSGTVNSMKGDPGREW